MKSDPGAGVDPRVPQKWTRTRSVSRPVFAAVAFSQLLKIRPLQLVGLDDGDPARGDRFERRGPGAPFEVRPFAQQRARSVFGQPLAVTIDADHAIEDEEDVGAGIPLFR